MRILITGGAGMVGSHCAEYFALKGNRVVILDNLMRSRLFGFDKKSVEFNWNYLKKYPNINRIKGDIRNEKDVMKALGDGVDAVIHTAGQPSVLLSVKEPEEDFSINCLGTLKVLECTRNVCKNAAFIYCSTNKVYGENVDAIPLKELDSRYIFSGTKGITEDLPTDLTGHTPYGVSKLAGDLYVQEYGHIYGMKTAVFRMSCIYGTRQFGFEDQGWVAWFIIAALCDKPITIYGSGKQVRDVLYVGDFVGAFEKFINAKLKNGVFNIGGGPDNTLSLLEFIAKLKQITGKKIKPKFADWRPSDQKVYISDISKISSALHWQPKVKPDEGIAKLVKWVRDNEGYFSG